MNLLIPVQYHSRVYPPDIKPHIQEVAGTFKANPRPIQGDYSLHTEYSYIGSTFASPALAGCAAIPAAQKAGVPQLWRSREWALDMARFVVNFAQGHAPKVIEIHPPFSDYTDLYGFLDTYHAFEAQVRRSFPHVQIFVENRSGTVYRGGVFVLSKVEDLCAFSQLIDQAHSSLRITLDLPQLLTAHRLSTQKEQELRDVLARVKSIRHNIAGIHLWGKRAGRSPQMGNLDTLFRGNEKIKQVFLQGVFDCFNDDVPRYFVPEVNDHNANLLAIVQDLKDTGFVFL